MRGSITAAAAIAALAIITAGAARPAVAQTELRNDGFETGAQVGFQAGFASGEIAAVRLVPAQAGVQVQSVRLLFGGATTTQTVTLKIWNDVAGNLAPGAELYSGDFQVMGSNTAMHELDVSGANVIVPGQFRVGIVFQHSGVPSVARDDDGNINASRNFINAQGLGWVQSQTLGLTGDWVIRAVIAGGTTPDAGVPDAGTMPDAATAPDAGTAECQGNADCPLGEYCDSANGACTFDCRSADDCPGGGACNSLGQCLGAEGDAGGCCSTERGGGGTGALAAGGLAVLVGLVVTRRRRRR